MLSSEIVDAVLSFDSDKVFETTKKALNVGEDPIKIIEEGLTKALKIVARKFEDGEFFLMDLVAAAEPAQRVIKDALEPETLRRKIQRKTVGRIVLGTVAGDIHDIGKNIVGAMWVAAGFGVHDLGKDIPTEEFITRPKEVNANILGASALLSTSLPMQSEIVKAMVGAGLRDRVKLMFGGAPVMNIMSNDCGATNVMKRQFVHKLRNLANIA
jgi:methanogenic corrinoid protein MtbC1